MQAYTRSVRMWLMMISAVLTSASPAERSNDDFLC